MSYNILIVDDSASMRAIIVKALRLSGVELGVVHEAGNGREALDVLASHWVDLILADLNMPEMNGVELIEHLRQQGVTGRIPVVIISTEGRPSIIDGLLGMGASGFLRKPFAPDQLGRVIESVLAAQPGGVDREAIVTSFFEALEGFAMLVAEVEEPPTPPETAVMTTVRFISVGAEGTLRLTADPASCQAIAQSATGEESGDGPDALAELANVTAGQLVDRIAGGPFGLFPPECAVGGGEDAWSAVLQAENTVCFDVEGNHVLVGIDVDVRR